MAKPARLAATRCCCSAARRSSHEEQRIAQEESAREAAAEAAAAHAQRKSLSRNEEGAKPETVAKGSVVPWHMQAGMAVATLAAAIFVAVATCGAQEQVA